MNKYTTIFFTAAITLFFPVASHGASPVNAPNIVLIVVDDLGYGDLSCAALAKDVETPNMDSLAQQGVRFTQAYATAPICNASRIALITGCYQQRQGQYWYGGPGLHDVRFSTIPEVLKARGYKTGYVGKFHYGASDAPARRGFPLNHGFDFFYGFSGGTKHYLHHRAEYKDRRLYEGPMWVQRKQQDVDGFTTELFGQEARRFIRANKNETFYLQLSFNAVHNYTYQLPADYLREMGLKGFADWDPSKEDYWAWRMKLGYPAHPEGRAYYLGQLHFLDLEIGRLLKELKAQGIEENTAIILVSDNGGSLVTYANNAPLKGGKYTLFEGGIRVPMMVTFPKQYLVNTVVDNVVTTMDLFPTLCSLAGAPIPKHLDGIDLTPLLSGKNPSLRDDVVYWDTGVEQAVRQGKWKLLVTKKVPNERLQIVDTPLGEFLFDLEKDPGETRDLAKVHPKRVEELRELLRNWQQNVSNGITAP